LVRFYLHWHPGLAPFYKKKTTKRRIFYIGLNDLKKLYNPKNLSIIIISKTKGNE